jgi:hypothetical protein
LFAPIPRRLADGRGHRRRHVSEGLQRKLWDGIVRQQGKATERSQQTFRVETRASLDRCSYSWRRPPLNWLDHQSPAIGPDRAVLQRDQTMDSERIGVGIL